MVHTTKKDVIEQYKELLAKKTGLDKTTNYTPPPTAEYQDFKKQFKSRPYTIYETLCNYSAKLVQVKPGKKKEKTLNDYITIAQLNTTPTGIYTAQLILPFAVLFIGLILSIVLFNSLFIAFVVLILSAIAFVLLGKLPQFFATNWRLRASNQMVLCIFYVVTYMKHTSNLENALKFAAQYLQGPLAKDLSRVLADGLTKHSTVQKALNKYLTTWAPYNAEFVHSFTLIQRSLLERTEQRRKETLDRALTEILEETQEKMLHYAQDLKSKVMTLHMLGIILPILGLVILPLLVSFIGETKWYHIALGYNIVIPLIVYLIAKNVLNQRPTGYGDSDLSETKIDIKKTVALQLGKKFTLNVQPLLVSLIVFLVLGFIALSPLLIHFVAPNTDFNIGLGLNFLDYRQEELILDSGAAITVEKGPFGLGAAIISLLLPLAFAFAIGLYYRLKIKNVYVLREQAHRVEREFSTSLYQLGNAMAQGQAPERAIVEASELMKNTASGTFFKQISYNIRRGQHYKDAIFNKKTGAMIQFPSNIINSSMRIMVESAKKSSKIAAEALWGISQYIKNIHRVNERLKDLLADIISDMKSQIAMLTPAIAGIVIGITSMITLILGKLSENFQNVATLEGGGQTAGALGVFQNLFGNGIPTYYFQIVVGIYVVQIVYILTILQNGIENGADSVGEQHSLGKNLINSTVTYCALALLVMIIFNVIAAVILSRSGV